jgi:hypothetical protein
MATFAEDIFLMMTREEVAEVITYCKKNDIFYKTRLAELGIPVWKFYDSKSRYALEQESSEANGEFLLLYAGGSPAPVPSFAATSGRKEASSSRMLAWTVYPTNPYASSSLERA